MRDSIETKTSSFKGKKTQKAMIDSDTTFHEAKSRESGNWILQPSPQLHIQIRFRILTK